MPGVSVGTQLNETLMSSEGNFQISLTQNSGAARSEVASPFHIGFAIHVDDVYAELHIQPRRYAEAFLQCFKPAIPKLVKNKAELVNAGFLVRNC